MEKSATLTSTDALNTQNESAQQESSVPTNTQGSSVDERFASILALLNNNPQEEPRGPAARKLQPMKLSDPLPAAPAASSVPGAPASQSLQSRIASGEGRNALQRPAPARATAPTGIPSQTHSRVTTFQIQPSLSVDSDGNNLQRRNRDIPDRPVIIMRSESKKIIWLTTDLHFTNRPNGAAIQRGVDELNRQKSSREVIWDVQDWELTITPERWPVESVQIMKACYYDYYSQAGYRVLGKRPNVGLPNPDIQLNIPVFQSNPLISAVLSTNPNTSTPSTPVIPAIAVPVGTQVPTEIPIQGLDTSSEFEPQDIQTEEYIPGSLNLPGL
jgi:hypothetical protein